MSDRRSDGVVAVERALSILNAIEAAEADALSLTQIAAATRLSKSTTSRLLVSLLRSVYILRLPDGKYQLGPAVSRLGLRFDRSFMLAKYAEGVVRRIADRCNETTSLSVRHGDTRVCIMRFEPRHAFQYGTKVGVHMTLANSPTGRVLREFEHVRDGRTLHTLPVGMNARLAANRIGQLQCRCWAPATSSSVR